MKIINSLKSFFKDVFSHNCEEHKKIISLETSTIANKKKIIKVKYKCQKCFRYWEEYK